MKIKRILLSLDACLPVGRGEGGPPARKSLWLGEVRVEKMDHSPTFTLLDKAFYITLQEKTIYLTG